MTKRKASLFVCQGCNYESYQWLGRCPSCQEWNSFQEESVVKGAKKKESSGESNQPLRLHEIETTSHQRYVTGMHEFDRVVGGGLVVGSLVLVGGEPGIGKSTLILQIMGALARKYPKENILYISGEESGGQIAGRSKRLKVAENNLYVLNETNWQKIEAHVKEIRPRFLVLDSIQTSVSAEVPAAAGSVPQIREVTYEVMNLAKSANITAMVIGHITKEGQIAGPKILEHMVDTVIYFDGDQFGQYRILRAIKNRFGNTNEVGIFEMSSEGLVEVTNPSQYFLTETDTNSSGRAVTCVVEGSQTLFVEVQSLVMENKFGNGRRTTQGLDSNRLAMLVAVVEKHCHMMISYNDIYVNIVGGIKAKDRATDLAICVSLISSQGDIVLPSDMVFLGEVGLTGEVRSIPHMEVRLKEIARLNYHQLVVSERSAKAIKQIPKGLRVIGVKNVGDLMSLLRK